MAGPHTYASKAAEDGLKPLLTVEQAAQVLGLSRWTLYRMVSERRVPHVHLGRAVRFEPGKLQQWVAVNRVAVEDRTSRQRFRP